MDSTLYAAKMKHACVFVAFLTQKLNLGCLEAFSLETTASSSLAMHPNFRGVLNAMERAWLSSCCNKLMLLIRFIRNDVHLCRNVSLFAAVSFSQISQCIGSTLSIGEGAHSVEMASIWAKAYHRMTAHS